MCKKFPKKKQKCIILAYFTKDFNNLVNFSRDWAKITIGQEIFDNLLKFFDENSLANLNFYIFFENLLLEIDPSVIWICWILHLFTFHFWWWNSISS